jgi:hypothetical protein
MPAACMHTWMKWAMLFLGYHMQSRLQSVVHVAEGWRRNTRSISWASECMPPIAQSGADRVGSYWPSEATWTPLIAPISCVGPTGLHASMHSILMVRVAHICTACKSRASHPARKNNAGPISLTRRDVGLIKKIKKMKHMLLTLFILRCK